MPEVVARAPQGWKNEHLDNLDTKVETEKEDIDLSEKERRSACRRYPSVIMDPEEIRKILQSKIPARGHLVKIAHRRPTPIGDPVDRVEEPLPV